MSQFHYWVTVCVCLRLSGARGKYLRVSDRYLLKISASHSSSHTSSPPLTIGNSWHKLLKKCRYFTCVNMRFYCLCVCVYVWVDLCAVVWLFLFRHLSFSHYLPLSTRYTEIFAVQLCWWDVWWWCCCNVISSIIEFLPPFSPTLSLWVFAALLETSAAT